MAVSAAEQALHIVDPSLAARQVVIECPQVYMGAKNKGDPNDLIDVAVTVGALIAVYGAFSWDLHIVKPATWKGQTPKAVTKNRLQKQLSTAEGEIAMWSNHNVVDAIGIGCWKLGRYR
jgi:hypothetical protein